MGPCRFSHFLYVIHSGITTLIVQFPLQPVVTEQLDWVLRSNRSVSAAKIISWAQLVASPADTLRVLRIQRNLGLRHMSPVLRPDHGQQHLEARCRLYRVRLFSRQQNDVACFHSYGCARDGNLGLAFNSLHKRVERRRVLA